MLAVVIKGPTFEHASEQIKAALPYADLIELRLDYFDTIDIAKELKNSFSIPMIFTLRSKEQGGNYKFSEEQRLESLRQLLELKPAYIDLEHHVPGDFIDNLSFELSSPESSDFTEEISYFSAQAIQKGAKFTSKGLEYEGVKPKPQVEKIRGTKVILSYHDFEKTPQDLSALYQSMKNKRADFYKIATYAQNAIDTLRLMLWAKEQDNPPVAISMGPHGEITRALAPLMRCPWTYASQEMPPHILMERYRFHASTPHTRIYGLIGSPITQSISDKTHNQVFHQNNLDALYVKMNVEPNELGEFLELARKLPFHGLSVTMPLKEYVLKHIDIIDEEARAIGAVNTLRFEDCLIKGFNTDGTGALHALEKRIIGKHIVIIGTGGSAKAIAYEAQKRGAHVTMATRSLEKYRLPYPVCALNVIKKYDILINATPLEMPIDPSLIIPGTVVMDIKVQKSELLYLAEEKKCHVIAGYEMFLAQAQGQFNIWFNSLSMTPSCSEQLL